MKSILSRVGSSIHPHKLTDEQHMWIGRLVRATAELEDIVTLYVCQLAEIAEGAATILLGRMPVSARVGIAKMLAQTRGDGSLELFNDCFESNEFKKLMRCRNTVTHGAFRGMTDAGELAFNVREIQDVSTGQITVSVRTYKAQGFKAYAVLAEELIITFEQRLGLTALRETRRSQPLTAHAKAQRPKKS